MNVDSSWSFYGRSAEVEALADILRRDQHVARFEAACRRDLEGRVFERVAVAPELSAEHRAACVARGYRPFDLRELTSW